ncbi:hypothetical protein [Nonomuraea endophytica]
MAAFALSQGESPTRPIVAPEQALERLQTGVSKSVRRLADAQSV